MTYKQAKIILSFAQNNMKTRDTANHLYFSEGNVHYFLRQVAAETGRDPKKFYDLCYLVGVAAQVMDGRKSVTYR